MNDFNKYFINEKWKCIHIYECSANYTGDKRLVQGIITRDKGSTNDQY
jgi:hypothetical protein